MVVVITVGFSCIFGGVGWDYKIINAKTLDGVSSNCALGKEILYEANLLKCGRRAGSLSDFSKSKCFLDLRVEVLLFDLKRISGSSAIMYCGNWSLRLCFRFRSSRNGM